ncbi:hypothetical protein [Mucilaginibacter antarcticus]|uniref:hypothetical protein n=1 Tax=Mucilaginibacter antarcticus TaxID=1855725 RepID=UPI0036348B82
MLFEEIRLNKDLIKSVQDSDFAEHDYDNDKQRQALRINTSLRKLYQVLSEESHEYPLVKNINAFSARYAQDYFFDITAEMLGMLTAYEPKEVYTDASAIIERKLMGKLCKFDFRTAFYCGLKTGNLAIEIYKFIDQPVWYIFYPSRNIFLLCDYDLLSNINTGTEVTRNDRIVQELLDKNDQLQSSASIIRINIPAEVKNLLAENYKKISDINFLQNIAGFDAQANILKAMLNTDMI